MQHRKSHDFFYLVPLRSFIQFCSLHTFLFVLFTSNLVSGEKHKSLAEYPAPHAQQTLPHFKLKSCHHKNNYFYFSLLGTNDYFQTTTFVTKIHYKRLRPLQKSCTHSGQPGGTILKPQRGMAKITNPLAHGQFHQLGI